MSYISVEIKNLSQEQSEIVIALMTAIGYEGFEESNDQLCAYIHDVDFNEEELQELASARRFTYTLKKIEERNWNQQWESDYKPVIIDDFAAIRASFHEPVKGVSHEIIITPKMSFGTGHHATTSMMVRMMSAIDFRGKKVLDFGTGTGILAILADRLGASEVTAVDNDDWSIENARENIAVNVNKNISLVKASSVEGFGEADIILANIIRAVIVENFPFFPKQLNSNGILLLSGLLVEDEPAIKEQADGYGFTVKKRLEERSWICLQLQYQP